MGQRPVSTRCLKVTSVLLRYLRVHGFYFGSTRFLVLVPFFTVLYFFSSFTLPKHNLCMSKKTKAKTKVTS